MRTLAPRAPTLAPKARAGRRPRRRSRSWAVRGAGRAAPHRPARLPRARPWRAPRSDLPSAGSSRSSDRFTVVVIGARNPRRDPAYDLVIDRPDAPSELLRGLSLAPVRSDQDRLVTGLRARLRSEIDGDVVHAHGADEWIALPSQEHVAVVRQRAPHAVAIADREGPDPCVALGDEPPAIADALAALGQLDRRHVGAQRKRRLQSTLARFLVHRVAAVDRDPAPHEVEVAGRRPQRRRAVGGVDDDPRKAGAKLACERFERAQLAV